MAVVSSHDMGSVDPARPFVPPPGPDSEEWRPVPGRTRWKVSSHGRIIGPSGRVLKPYFAGKYLAFRPGLGEPNFYVHRAVALAFHGPAPAGHEVGHRDGNRFNNRADNLGWITRVENAADRVHHGTARTGKRFLPKETEDYLLLLVEFRVHMGLNLTAIARLAGVSRDTVQRVVVHGARQPAA